MQEGAYMAGYGQAPRVERIQYHRAFRVLTRLLHDHGRMVRPVLADQEHVPVGVPGIGGGVVGLELRSRATDTRRPRMNGSRSNRPISGIARSIRS